MDTSKDIVISSTLDTYDATPPPPDEPPKPPKT